VPADWCLLVPGDSLASPTVRCANSSSPRGYGNIAGRLAIAKEQVHRHSGSARRRRARTMFPYLPGVADELEHVDLASLARRPSPTSTGIGQSGRAAARAIQTSAAAGVPRLLNIVPRRCLLASRRATGSPRLILRTGITDTSPKADIRAERAVVTAAAVAGGARDPVCLRLPRQRAPCPLRRGRLLRRPRLRPAA
jgi:hypothetical protein